jgi:hypothetical protein
VVATTRRPSLIIINTVEQLVEEVDVPRRFGLTVAVVAASAIMLAPSASYAGSISESKLSSELLTASQMPFGWTSSSTTDQGLGCLHDLLEPYGIKQTHTSQAYFLGTVDHLPRFDEKIATYANAKTAYKKIIATINSCHTTDGVVNGVKVTGTVAPMTFTHFGDASSTYAMVDSDVRGTLHYDYTIVRKGSVVGAFLEGSFPSVIASEFQALVEKGVARLS